MIKKVHHIDFVVRDLDAAVERYRLLFGVDPLPRESLPDRGVAVHRFRIGEIWIILVQPIRADSPVQRVLDEQGEGFFHIAYLTDDVAAEAERLRQAGFHPVQDRPRTGVEGWKLIDLAQLETAGVLSQLIEER